ncbi:16S rRNA (cytidine(1402)-2'-O)-methyltransferase [Patescibacteria group bacterium]|nr:16S rRNA (cytidine(1402)-2'-O)-methyltransferase [Patescibacteria group bacterium]MBU4347460.1 16S rRNA (cytidine(1402)-2'-O)-methyltransferase [Patescibacteria group bacterium]MBU4455336.1 16S rRNA (cytidine(1402)-2'-O)-methyltransferase [Patescibacteria group bacterium]MCG2690601.1 16S rRNA (cytidine(1402)-2'-O)-methyltransferase [Candidatus Parcubacteria bacterium]
MLYIVATPIGNLEDISLRALRVLGEVDFILCEDTRVTGKLLAHFKIKTPTISFHQHSDLKKIDYVLSLLEGGKDLALVTDAGTPGISDPGGKLVQAAIEKFGDDARIESVPGPSAVTAALSISGIPTDKFVFMGFPPHKKGRQTFLKKILESEWPVVVYESKHRIIKFLEELKKMSNDKFLMTNQDQNPNDKNKKINLTSVVVCRELSKMHETVYRGELKSIIEKIKSDPNAQKGEFVVIIGK